MTVEIQWSRLTGPEIRNVASRKDALAILPLGSLEQHGPHLPVITDTSLACEVSLRAARIVADEIPVLVMPGLWTGMSEHHLPFGGTISLNFAELRGVLTGITRSLRVLGFSRFLILNYHGGNVDPLGVACRELCIEFGMPVVAVHPWMIDSSRIDPILETHCPATGNFGHACEGETSMILATTPELVRSDRINDAVRETPGVVTPRRGFQRFWSFSELEPVTGVMGDPRKASAEKGELLFDTLAELVATGIRDKSLWRTPDPVWTPGRGQGNTAGSLNEK